jgi:DNA-binding MarR family transcriptional regulator
LDVIDSVIKARRRYVSSIFEKLTLEEKQQLANSLERLHSLMLDKAV